MVLRNPNKIIGNEHPVAKRLQTGRVNLQKPLAKKTDWQEIEQLPGQTIREKFQKKLGVEVDPGLTFKKLEESLKYKV
jgi:hypothetical protein|tara:strand:- start:207 stop:440 length:234 start_codon:yes stop_codon:yes gene_type:complete